METETTFTAQIEDFIRLVEGRAEAVLKNSAQRVFSIAQNAVADGGNMPVVTGFLLGSLVSFLNDDESSKKEGAESYLLALADFKLGDKMFGGWTAEYALRIEHGFVGADKLGRVYNQSGRHYMEKAASMWPKIVAEESERFRGK